MKSLLDEKTLTRSVLVSVSPVLARSPIECSGTLTLAFQLPMVELFIARMEHAISS
jgi:hypothetical protein